MQTRQQVTYNNNNAKEKTITIPRRILEWRGSTAGLDDAFERLDALLLALTNKTSKILKGD